METRIKKRLVHCIYVTDKIVRGDNLGVKLNLYCLKKYYSVFDEAIIIISIDDLNDFELIKDAKALFNDIYIPKMTFIVRKNTYLCESGSVYDEIFSDAKKYDGLTFLSHAKGSIAFDDYNKEKENIFKWIVGSYFLNLEWIEEMVYKMMYYETIFYGSFLTDTDKLADCVCCAGSIYQGTFYWINIPKLLKFKNEAFDARPEDRWYLETLPGRLFEWHYKDFYNKLASHQSRKLNSFSLYITNIDDVMKFLAKEDTDRFKELCDEIKKDLDINFE